jgi:hypothetical protein
MHMQLTFLEWIGRTAMLVLAGLITLSIIGAIASIPSGSIETRFGMDGDTTSPIGDEPSPAAPQGKEAGSGTQAGVGAAQPLPASPANSRDAPARWLEAITYALIALAGVAALGLILLWRGVRALERLADGAPATIERIRQGS